MTQPGASAQLMPPTPPSPRRMSHQPSPPPQPRLQGHEKHVQPGIVSEGRDSTGRRGPSPPNDMSSSQSHDVPGTQRTETRTHTQTRTQTQTQTRASHEPNAGTRPSSTAAEQGPHGAHVGQPKPRSSDARLRQHPSDEYDAPDNYQNLGEVADSAPAPKCDEEAFAQYKSLRKTRERGRHPTTRRDAPGGRLLRGDEPARGPRVSRHATQLYTISYLVFFSFLGTLARIGLQALTNYPGAPVFPSVWFNLGGSLVMGFLAEDRMLFRNELGAPTYDAQVLMARHGEGGGDSDAVAVDLVAANKAHQATKKTIPLYIGLATGFCGSFTSFSALVRDVFLALSNDLPQPGSQTTVPRNGGYSLMAALAVIIITVTASLSGLFVGAHMAIALEPLTPSLPYKLSRNVLDRLAVFLGWGCWVGALLLTALPPHEHWRGDATFSLVFAPLGTLARFYASLWLNGRKASFPLGTFAVNVFGTAVLGMAWDLQRVPLGGVVGCQVLQGIEDGFCGCLTTVSTWVSELSSLTRKHAWMYGIASVLVSVGVMVIIMGGLRWTRGFAGLQCIH